MYEKIRHLQEKIRKYSPVKQKLLQYVESQCKSQNEFYKNTGVSRGTLTNSSKITEGLLAKIFAIYEDINIEWLFTGKGEMLKEVYDNSKKLPIAEEEMAEYKVVDKDCSEKLQMLKDNVLALEKAIVHIEGRLKDKDELISILKNESVKNKSPGK